MPTVRMFASAREAAGRTNDDIEGVTLGEVLAEASRRYGPTFAAVLQTCRCWINGEPPDPELGLDTPVQATDEIAVLPPVSGG